MLLSEVRDYLFYRNGQHISGDLARLRLDMQKFWIIMKPEIEDYCRYIPIEKKFNVLFSDSGGIWKYDFESDPHNVGYDSGTDPITFGNPPKRFKKIVPIGENQMVMNWVAIAKRGTIPGQIDNLRAPRPFPYEYEDGKVYCGEVGKMYIIAQYDAYFKPILNEQGQLTDVDIIGLNQTKILNDVLSGVFLQEVGRVRRAFTREDFPIKTDAEELVREGIDLYDKARIEMQQRAKWAAFKK